jgi:uncharacterized lipoprotein YddW (UPF0748 family)
MKASLYTLALLPFLLSAQPGVAAAKAQTPGKAGVYCKLNDVIKSEKDLKRTMSEIKAAGIDFILPYTKLTNGKVRWASDVAPQEMIDTPDFLEKVIKAAHAAGLQVYPVFCVATEGGDENTNFLLQRNPTWAFVKDGKPIGYIDPGNAAARDYQARLMAEMAAKYPIDGISLDYMRMPNRVGYTHTARQEFLKTRNVDLAEITGGDTGALETEGGKKAAAKAASTARAHPIWPEYREWRRNQINAFMRQLRQAVHEVRPGLPISSYCWGAHTMTGNFETAQDWVTWIKDGQLEWINPSGYRYTDEAFNEAAALNRKAIPEGFPYYITIGVSTSHGKLENPAELRKQMQFSRDAGADGLIFFTWEALRKFMPESGKDIREWQPKGK